MPCTWFILSFAHVVFSNPVADDLAYLIALRTRRYDFSEIISHSPQLAPFFACNLAELNDLHHMHMCHQQAAIPLSNRYFRELAEVSTHFMSWNMLGTLHQQDTQKTKENPSNQDGDAAIAAKDVIIGAGVWHCANEVKDGMPS